MCNYHLYFNSLVYNIHKYVLLVYQVHRSKNPLRSAGSALELKMLIL